MSSADDPDAIRSHWLVMRPVALWLTLAWAVVTFAPAFFAREPSFEIAGASLAAWIGAQFGPLIYVLLAWWYQRSAERLDQHGG